MYLTILTIQFYSKENILECNLIISNLIHLLQGVPDMVSNLEILYIGKGTSDCAIDRLNGHSTLETILADILQKEPYNEIAFLLYKFEMSKPAFQIRNSNQKVEITGKKAKDHFQDVFDYKPDIEEQTRLIEALLIDYFKTHKYNSQYAKGININNKLFDNVRKIDIDAVIVDIDNENIGRLKMFSKGIEPNFYHRTSLDFRKKEGRISHLDNQSTNIDLLIKL